MSPPDPFPRTFSCPPWTSVYVVFVSDPILPFLLSSMIIIIIYLYTNYDSQTVHILIPELFGIVPKLKLHLEIKCKHWNLTANTIVNSFISPSTWTRKGYLIAATSWKHLKKNMNNNWKLRLRYFFNWMVASKYCLCLICIPWT